MTRSKFLKLLLIAFTCFCHQHVDACSMYKITAHGKTIIGCNEDAWRLTPHIWFETATQASPYGAAFTGSRFDGANGYAPQSGMNERGLTFSRLASYTPEDGKPFTGRQAITNPTLYLRDIMHHCRTIDEVQAYISKYDHSFFLQDVFIYIDSTGKYLVVEPYTMTVDNNANYVLSNFCPSVTPQDKARKLERYANGVDFINSKPIDTSLAYSTALSDAMHVCRKKIGDGTLLTSIWKPQNGTVNLYFYHNYDTTVQFNIKDELAKGDHILAINMLFPVNKEFGQLRDFQTPQNNKWILFFMMGAALLFLFSAVYYGVAYLRRRSVGQYNYIMLLLVFLGIALPYYLYILATEISIFYFSAPYQDPQNALVTTASYLPYLLLVLMIPFAITNFRLFRSHTWGGFSKLLLTMNNLVFVGLIGLWWYWRFYGV